MYNAKRIDERYVQRIVDNTILQLYRNGMLNEGIGGAIAKGLGKAVGTLGAATARYLQNGCNGLQTGWGNVNRFANDYYYGNGFNAFNILSRNGGVQRLFNDIQNVQQTVFSAAQAEPQNQSYRQCGQFLGQALQALSGGVKASQQQQQQQPQAQEPQQVQPSVQQQTVNEAVRRAVNGVLGELRKRD